MGDRIRAAWADGTLVLPLRDRAHPLHLAGTGKHTLLPGLGGEAQVHFLGTGETFAAWQLSPTAGPALTVRIPWRTPFHPLRQEIAALALTPRDVGPDPVMIHEDPDESPLGVPYLVTTTVAGTMLPPERWTRAHLFAHARHLAVLHSVPAPGRGPAVLGADPWERTDRSPTSSGPFSLLPLFEADVEAAGGAVIDRFSLGPLLERVRRGLRRLEGAFSEIEGYVLCHGDLCATNIVWDTGPGGSDPDSAPRPDYIDFEWAQADDPARDLAIIGGSVHAAPWYVPLGEGDVAAFLAEYLEARGLVHRTGVRAREVEGVEGAPTGDAPSTDGTPVVPDLAALRARRDGWEIYEKSAMLLHLAGRIAEEQDWDQGRDQDADHPSAQAGSFAQLRSTLGARLS
jgi:aminoglycoside phosphotransferase (APT) family kinase protein